MKKSLNTEKKNIALCGFMGCGKSYKGARFAEKNGLKFIDLDCYIEENAKLSIPEIFTNFGEDYFRDLEYNAISELSSLEGIVFALGGGALTFERNALVLKKNSFIIFIDSPFKICYERIKGDENRPIAKSKTKKELHALYKKRKKLYKKYSNLKVKEKSGLDKLII